MDRNKLRKLIEIAIFAAIALVFDLFIPSLSPAFKISIKMLPIIILALRWGLGAGLAGGFLWGLLQIVVGDAEIVSLAQALIEYLFAFAAVGLTGLLAKPVQNTLRSNASPAKSLLLVDLAAVIGCFARYIFHFIAGIVFWGMYAPESQPAWLYSLSVNGTAFLTETLTCLVVLSLMAPAYKTVILNRDFKE